MAYVEGDLDRMCESWLDISRELDRSNGYSHCLSILGIPRISRPGQLTGPRPLGCKQVVATPSHLSSSCVPGKMDTPKPRCMGARITCPDEIKIRVRTPLSFHGPCSTQSD
ncbi:hypothetical protein CRG98_001067 [Punica granatum]|uniref:Uncharacterized protein n=1 Tax=Punica granatum TaxID=22663 RepID=A0A2I0LCX6_PUNGR|nr:hypothetical protein CRG98_001067 [Punica granatum]